MARALVGGSGPSLQIWVLGVVRAGGTVAAGDTAGSAPVLFVSRLAGFVGAVHYA
jgi:hypothetical protein